MGTRWSKRLKRFAFIIAHEFANPRSLPLRERSAPLADRISHFHVESIRPQRPHYRLALTDFHDSKDDSARIRIVHRSMDGFSSRRSRGSFLLFVSQLMARFLSYADPSLTSGRVRGQPFRDAVTRANRQRICVTVTRSTPTVCLPLCPIFAPRHFNVSSRGRARR